MRRNDVILPIIECMVLTNRHPSKNKARYQTTCQSKFGLVNFPELLVEALVPDKCYREYQICWSEVLSFYLFFHFRDNQ